MCSSPSISNRHVSGKEVCKAQSSDSYPVFLQDLSEGNGLRANEAPKILYIVAALENITFESDKPALLFAWNSLGVVVVASCNEPLNLAGQVFCETKSVRPVAQLIRQEMPWEPLVCMCSQWCRGRESAYAVGVLSRRPLRRRRARRCHVGRIVHCRARLRPWQGGCRVGRVLLLPWPGPWWCWP